jgi:hypothetical protein
MTSYVEKLLTHLSVSVPPGGAQNGGGAKSDPSENSKIEESEVLTHLQGSTDITDIRVKSGFPDSENAGIGGGQIPTPPPTPPNRALTEVWSGGLGATYGLPGSSPIEGARGAPYAPPTCMECGCTGRVAYLELEGGDLLCGSCYAATLRELAAIKKSVEDRSAKRVEKKAEERK